MPSRAAIFFYCAGPQFLKGRKKPGGKKKRPKTKGKMNTVYLLMDGSKRLSYRGFTNNMERRLRQHKGLIKGGAVYTKRFGSVHLVATVSGFPTQRHALSFEWFTKRRRGPSPPVHVESDRVSRFFAPLAMPKFKPMNLEVTLSASHFVPDSAWQLEDGYGVVARRTGPNGFFPPTGA
jgi:predicted GIY-YIG superfamily endonuclease